MTRARLILGVATLLAVGAVVALAGDASAQQRVQAEVLGGDGPLAFQPIDTYIQEVGQPEDPPHEEETVELRGEDTRQEPDPDPDQDPTEEEGRRVYLLSLSRSGGGGIPTAIRDRYVHGELTDAALTLEYTGGCDGALGTLTVRAIESRGWDPRTVTWNDTDLSGNQDAPVQLLGPVVARGQAGLDAGNCTRMDLELPPSAIAPVLEGEQGGLVLLWEAPHPITLSTRDDQDGPRLTVDLVTNAPQVVDVDLGAPPPLVVEPGAPMRLQAVLNGSQEVPDGGVVGTVEAVDTGDQVLQTVASKIGNQTWRSDVPAPDEDGRFTVQVQATDRFGWTATGRPQAEGVDLVVDGQPPTIENATLGGHAQGDQVVVDQFRTVPLDLVLGDELCRAQVDPCLAWTFTWGPEEGEPVTRLNGTGSPDAEGLGRIEAQLPMERPGNWTARLTVEDPLGHANQTLWRLEVRDTRAPQARALEGSRLGPNVSATVEEGQPIPVAVEILDDPPVDLALVFQARDGEAEVRRELPSAVEETTVSTEVQPPPLGDHAVRLELDDGGHSPVLLPWGNLTVGTGEAPLIHVEPVGRRLGPNATIDVQIADGDLNLEATVVRATVGGDPVTPSVTLGATDDGGNATVRVQGLTHGDVVNLTVRAEDSAGRQSTVRETFTVDHAPPELVAPRNGTWFGPGAVVRVHAEDPGGGTVTLQVATPGGLGELTPPALVPVDRLLPAGHTGPQNVTFLLQDDVGNEIEIQRRLGLDDEAPELEARLDHDGLRVLVRDGHSNVTEVRAWAGVGDRPMEQRDTLVEAPGVYRVLGVGQLTRGDLVHVAFEADDAAGNTARLGSRFSPETLVAPGPPPRVELERRSPAVGSLGTVAWSIHDPADRGVIVTLAVTDPGGQTTVLEEQAGEDRYTVEPEAPGRYAIEVVARAGQAEANATTFFLLSPEGPLTGHEAPPERVAPGEELRLLLRPPGPPEEAFVWAEDEDGVQHRASVAWDDGGLVAHFDQLPEGRHELHATLLHEPGAVEELDLGSVQVGISSREHAEAAVPWFLGALALAGLVAAVVAVVRARSTRDEG